MDKKVIIGIIAVIVIIALAVLAVAVTRNNNQVDNTNNSNRQVSEEENSENQETLTNNGSDKKVLVAYFSAQNHTKAVAEKVANNLNADVFEIVPEEAYTGEDLDSTNDSSRVSREHNSESLKNIKLKKTKVDNLQDYDIILIGYPIWWGIAAWPVDNFVKENNFDGKTVIPFCTSSSSGLGQSGKLLEEKAKSGNWLEGMRFTSNPLDSAIKTWTDSIK